MSFYNGLRMLANVNVAIPNNEINDVENGRTERITCDADNQRIVMTAASDAAIVIMNANGTNVTGNLKLNNKDVATADDISPLKEQLANLNSIVHETVAQTVEETYDNVDSITTPSMVNVSGTNYPVIDNTRMMMAEVLGNTRKMVQLINISSLQTRTYGNVTFAPNATTGEIVVTIGSGGSISTSYQLIWINTPTTNANHKLLIKGCPSGGSTNTYSMALVNVGGTRVSPYDYGEGAIVTSPTTGVQRAWIVIESGVPEGTYTFKPQLFDLTAMGLESATIAEFNALFPSEYYNFENGNVYNSKTTGMTSKDSNQNVLGTINFPSQILRGIDTAQDELVITKNSNNVYYTLKSIAKIGRVDLGTLNWYTSLDFFYTTLDDKKTNSINLLSGPYTTDSVVRTDAAFSSQPNMTLGANALNQVNIKNTAYTDAAAFKTAMSGTYLEYELETATEETISNTLTYNQVSAITKQGGTLAVTGNSNSAYAKPDLTLNLEIKYWQEV